MALQGALEDELLSHLDVLPGFKNRWKEWLSFFAVASIRRGVSRNRGAGGSSWKIRNFCAAKIGSDRGAGLSLARN